MKHTSFKGLLYRELYLAKKNYLAGVTSFFLFAVLGWVVFFSLKYGNLAYFVDGFSDGKKSLLVSGVISDSLRLVAILYLKLLPSFMAMELCMFTANTAAKDLLTGWMRFEHSTPVAPFQYAAVKTASTAIMVAGAFFLALLYYVPISYVLGEPFSYQDFSVITIFCAVLTLWGVTAQIMILLLKNKDMGFLSSAGLIMAPIIAVSFFNSRKEQESVGGADPLFTLDHFMSTAVKYAPWFWIVLALSFLVLFVSMYFLYQRREK